jgi:CubicO group peptidase (beta-lactamase class C family)
MNRRLVLFALAALLATPNLALAGGSKPDAAARIRRVETGLLPPLPVAGEPGWTIEERMKYYKVPGVSVAVIDNYEVVWAKGYGLADVASKRPVTADTRFQAASISKPVTAVAAMRMVRAGQLSLDRPVNEQLTSWKLPDNDLTRATPVTLRRLFSHSAGTTVHGFPGYAVTERIPSIVDVLEGRGNTAPIRVDLAPGTQFRYSGGGTSVAQLLMSDVAKMPFPEIMREQVLAPVGMTSSTYEQPLPARLAEHAATGYRRDVRPVEGRYHVYPEMAAAGLWTTPADLARLLAHLQTALAGRDAKTILPREAVAEMIDARVEVDPGAKVGIGPFVPTVGGRRYFGHGGSNEGFQCYMIASAEGGKGAVVMTNSDNGSPITQEIVRAIAREYGWEGYVPEPAKPVALSPDQLRALEGRYLVEEDAVAIIRLAGDRLEYTREGQTWRLYPTSATTFFRREAPTRYEFGSVEGVPTLTIRPGEQVFVAKRIAADVVVPAELLWSGRHSEAVERYRAIWRERPESPVVAQDRLNQTGYTLLGDGHVEAAIAIFTLNTELRPNSANAYDSLADARLAAGDRKGAAEAYRKVLAALPGDTREKEATKAALRANAERFLAGFKE